MLILLLWRRAGLKCFVHACTPFGLPTLRTHRMGLQQHKHCTCVDASKSTNKACTACMIRRNCVAYCTLGLPNNPSKLSLADADAPRGSAAKSASCLVASQYESLN